jgi:uncharacterized membrane protein
MAWGKLHLLVLHFPIALILATLLADGLFLATKRGFFKTAGLYCLILAALAAIPTVIFGDILLDAEEFTGAAAALAETHESLGIATLVVTLLAAGVRLARRGEPRGVWAYGYAALIVAAGVLVSLAGHWGGMLALPGYTKWILW